MAVVIASELNKDIAGSPLRRGVSFKLERRDRMTIAGRNGAGKTTLLRMLAGGAAVDGGALGVAEGTGGARPDPAPPRGGGVVGGGARGGRAAPGAPGGGATSRGATTCFRGGGSRSSSRPSCAAS